MIFYLVPHFAVLGDSKMAKYRHKVYVSNIEIICYVRACVLDSRNKIHPSH